MAANQSTQTAHDAHKNPALPTTYDGTNFRSRLESRWAAAFNLIGWEWTYEPIDGVGYLPDFLIAGPHPFLIEVKPAASPADYHEPVAKAVAGLGGSWNHDLVIVGADITAPLGGLDPAMGLAVNSLHGPDDWHTARAWWVECRICGNYGITEEGQEGLVRPCGHEVPPWHSPMGRDALTGLWRSAGNLVQWRAVAS